MNLLDYLIIILLILALMRGFARGAIVIALDLLSFFVSLLAAFYLAPLIEPVLNQFLKLTDALRRPIAFVAAYLIVNVILSILNWLILKLTIRFEQSLVNKMIGAIISTIYAVVTIGILLILAVNLPLRRDWRTLIDHSRLSNQILEVVSPIRLPVEKTLKTAIDKVTETITIKPKSDERLTLHIKPKKLVVNGQDEQVMIRLVNEERKSRGLRVLEMDEALRQVARKHAQDMWERQYFAHVNPDGHDPFDRLKADSITFITAGENLALAPTIEQAHTGLMNSPGHRANILEGVFGQVGIGVITGEPYGDIVVQLFTD
jgi:uncharacterized protein YkwD